MVFRLIDQNYFSMVNEIPLLEQTHDPVGDGVMTCTGYPVMVVDVEMIRAQATRVSGEAEITNDDIVCEACMIPGRNNEIVQLIAKDFLTFLHELTIISTLQTISVHD